MLVGIGLLKHCLGILFYYPSHALAFSGTAVNMTQVRVVGSMLINHLLFGFPFLLVIPSACHNLFWLSSKQC